MICYVYSRGGQSPQSGVRYEAWGCHVYLVPRNRTWAASTVTESREIYLNRRGDDVYEIDSERRIAVVADTHQGARVGLWYPIEDDTGSWIYPNQPQERLLEYWHDYQTEIDKFDADTILLAGDLANGNERKEFGQGTVTTSLPEQVKSCVEMLRPVTFGRRVHGVQGSPYHQALECSLDQMIVEELGGTFHGKLANILLEGPERVLFLSHGDSASLLYRETDLARESVYMDAIERMMGWHIDLVVRGHWHWFYTGKNRSRKFVQCPGWKLWFPWKTKLWAKMVPDIGGVLIRVTKRTVTAEERLYPYFPVHDRLKRG